MKLDFAKNEIIKLYEDRVSTTKIGDLYGVSDVTVASLLKRNGITVTKKRCRTPINSNYFKVVDTANKSYFLGLIAADGSIFKTSKGKMVFSLQLQEKDKDILDSLSIELSGSVSMVRNDSRTDPAKQKMFTIRFSDEIFIENLMDLGILPRKTENLDWINLPENLIRDFIRGYFDGDGSVYISNNNVYGNFVGNKIFIPKLRDYLFEKSILPTRYAIIDRGNFCSFHFGSKEGNLSLYNYMYYDECLCLERKKVKFEFCPL